MERRRIETTTRAQSAESLVEHLAEAWLPTRYGEFVAHVYRTLDDDENVALVMGQVDPDRPVLVRVHSECLTGDLLGSLRCDCGAQLDLALRAIAREGSGILVYLRGHEGRGIGLAQKLRAYQLQDRGLDTVEANTELGLPVDARRYDVAAQMLTHLGARRIRLLSNNPAKVAELTRHALEIVERVPLETEPTAENRRYLATKKSKLGHYLKLD
jgi:3,4-dihydroxy 2-butanone 4-phosphate synthase / GTP cyclohydrolase II